MTTQEIIDSGAIGTYRKSKFAQGMSSYPCYEIDFRAGVFLTSNWAKPTSKKAVIEFIRKHKAEDG